MLCHPSFEGYAESELNAPNHRDYIANKKHP
jgi:hypothetical protein